jgi:hypothetical protein
MRIEYWCQDRYERLRHEQYDHRFTVIPRIGEFVKLPNYNNRMVANIVHDPINEFVKVWLHV